MTKWVKLYKYTCDGCRKRRTTRRLKVFKEAICRPCRPTEVSKDQLSLFEDGEIPVDNVDKKTP